MAMDPLEKEHWRRRIALRMEVFAEANKGVTCVSAHVYADSEPHLCELCQETHSVQLLVIKNRKHKVMHVDLDCLKEMIRFQVVDVDDLSKWLAKLSELRAEARRRKAEEAVERQEEVRRLERKVIVRKRPAENA